MTHHIECRWVTRGENLDFHWSTGATRTVRRQFSIQIDNRTVHLCRNAIFGQACTNRSRHVERSRARRKFLDRTVWQFDFYHADEYRQRAYSVKVNVSDPSHSTAMTTTGWDLNLMA